MPRIVRRSRTGSYDVPVKSADGTYNFANVSLGLWLGYPGGGYIPGVPAAEATIAVQ